MKRPLLCLTCCLTLGGLPVLATDLQLGGLPDPGTDQPVVTQYGTVNLHSICRASWTWTCRSLRSYLHRNALPRPQRAEAVAE